MADLLRASLGRRATHAFVNPCHNAAMQRMSWPIMTAKSTTGDEEPRLAAALVYPDHACADRWFVRPPEPTGDEAEPIPFSGPNACHAALEFAHENFGCARYFTA